MTPENNLRENLFNAEPVARRQQRFRQELAQIVEPKLPSSHRLYEMSAWCAWSSDYPARPGASFSTPRIAGSGAWKLLF